MEFGIEKCAMLIMRNGKRQITDGKEPPNQEIIGMLGEKEICKYPGILEDDTFIHVGMNGKFLKRVSKTSKKTSRNQVLQQKSHQKK